MAMCFHLAVRFFSACLATGIYCELTRTISTAIVIVPSEFIWPNRFQAFFHWGIKIMTQITESSKSSDVFTVYCFHYNEIKCDSVRCCTVLDFIRMKSKRAYYIYLLNALVDPFLVVRLLSIEQKLISWKIVFLLVIFKQCRRSVVWWNTQMTEHFGDDIFRWYHFTSRQKRHRPALSFSNTNQ